MNKKPMITVNTEIYAPIENIWKTWNDPNDMDSGRTASITFSQDYPV